MTRRSSSRLETVGRVRDIMERRALGRLAVGQRQHREAERRLRRAEQAYDERFGQVVTSPQTLLADRLAGMGAQQAVRTATEGLDVAAHRRGELEAEWSQASIARKSIERLAERRAAEDRASADRDAARELDEMVLLRRAGT